jgi:hypothetical protein
MLLTQSPSASALLRDSTTWPTAPPCIGFPTWNEGT